MSSKKTAVVTWERLSPDDLFPTFKVGFFEEHAPEENTEMLSDINRAFWFKFPHPTAPFSLYDIRISRGHQYQRNHPVRVVFNHSTIDRVWGERMWMADSVTEEYLTTDPSNPFFVARTALWVWCSHHDVEFKLRFQRPGYAAMPLIVSGVTK
jgi:hypothetical protein